MFSVLQMLSAPGLGLTKMTFLQISKLDVPYSWGCLSPPPGKGESCTYCVQCALTHPPP